MMAAKFLTPLMISFCLAGLIVVAAVVAQPTSTSERPLDLTDEELAINGEQPFFVHIKPGAGLSWLAPFNLTLVPSDTVIELKKMIMLHENGKLPIDQQLLSVDGKELADHNSKLSEYKIGHQTVILVTRKLSKAELEKPLYFGVDATDKQAVEDIQRHLGDKQFRDLFGNDINPDDMKFHHEGQLLDPVHEKIRGVFNWLHRIVTGGGKAQGKQTTPKE